MVKNFFEYVKELIPEKGSVFFTHQNHRIYNAISLYQLADLLCGQKIDFAEDVIAYSWNVPRYLNYGHEMMGLMFWFLHGKDYSEPEEAWIHFSKNAFIGAICIVATRNGITFDDPEFENARQAWARKLEHKETEEDKKYTDLNEANFTEDWYYYILNPEKKRPVEKFKVDENGNKRELTREEREELGLWSHRYEDSSNDTQVEVIKAY